MTKESLWQGRGELHGLGIAEQETLQLAWSWQGKWRNGADAGRRWDEAAPWDVVEGGRESPAMNYESSCKSHNTLGV